MRVLFPAVVAAVVVALPVAALADPVELTGQFLIERDVVAALPGAPSPADAVPGGIVFGTWVVDGRELSREVLEGGGGGAPHPFASGFTVSIGGQALYGEVMSHSRVIGQNAPANGASGDRLVIDAFSTGATTGDLDAMRLVLTGPADWFETTAPGALPDLSRATVTFEGRMVRGGQIVQERSGQALHPVVLRLVGPDLSIAAPDASETDSTLFGV